MLSRHFLLQARQKQCHPSLIFEKLTRFHSKYKKALSFWLVESPRKMELDTPTFPPQDSPSGSVRKCHQHCEVQIHQLRVLQYVWLGERTARDMKWKSGMVTDQ